MRKCDLNEEKWMKIWKNVENRVQARGEPQARNFSSWARTCPWARTKWSVGAASPLVFGPEGCMPSAGAEPLSAATNSILHILMIFDFFDPFSDILGFQLIF